MITNRRMPGVVGPKIVHNKNKKILSEVKKISKSFTKEMQSALERMALEGELKNEYLFKDIVDSKRQGEILLELRRKLIYSIRKGMLERKDLELNVAVLSSLIWFGRQEKERRDAIMESW